MMNHEYILAVSSVNYSGSNEIQKCFEIQKFALNPEIRFEIQKFA